MNRHGSLLAFVVSLGCAAQAPPPAAAPPALPPPPPQGSKRLLDSLACETQPPCADCTTTTGDQARPVGSLDKEVVRAGIRSHIDQMKACYDSIADSHPEKQGRVIVRFAIAPSGAVETSCLVASSLNEASVDRCVVERPLGWRFPEPQGGGWVVVDYPFVFER
jgi:TonB family protein